MGAFLAPFFMIKISISNCQKDLKISSKQVKFLFKTLIDFKKIKVNELEVHFITDKKMKLQHQLLFQDPSSTDCITCPIDDPYEEGIDYCVLGSCFICPKTAILYAQKKNLDPYEETSLYCVHCFLHLIGYDDINPSAKRVMRSQEKACMGILKEKNALLKMVP